MFVYFLLSKTHRSVVWFNSTFVSSTASEKYNRPNKTKRSRTIYLDILRILTTLGIITLHSATNIQQTSHWWSTPVIVETCLRWGIPILVMISGVLLLNPSNLESPALFLKRRSRKIIVPFLFWAVLYMRLLNFLAHQNLPPSEVINNILEGKVFFHLWFVYMIVGLYLITPIIQVYVKNASEENLRYFLLLWLMANFLTAFSEKFLGIHVALAEYLEMMGYVGFFIMGYYLDRAKFTPFELRIIYLLATAGLIASLVGTYYLSEKSQAFDGFFNKAFRLNNILTSVGIFLFIKNLEWDRFLGNRAQQFIFYLSTLTYGVYLSHLMVSSILRRGVVGLAVTESKIGNWPVNLYLGIGLVSILTTVICFTLVGVLKKIPLVRKLTV